MTQHILPETLIGLRNNRHWTQEDLSGASGISVRTIQRIESGEPASLNTAKSIAAAFDMPLETLRAPLVADTIVRTEFSSKQAAINATIGCAGGLIGCSFGWWGIFQAVPDFQGAIQDATGLTALVTIATAFCLIVPIVQWRRLTL